MPKSSEEERPPEPLLHVVWSGKRDGRTRTCSVTVGSSAIAIVLIVIGSHGLKLQDILGMLTRFVLPH